MEYRCYHGKHYTAYDRSRYYYLHCNYYAYSTLCNDDRFGNNRSKCTYYSPCFSKCNLLFRCSSNGT